MIHVGFDRDWPETPTTGMCCMGSVVRGANGCMCWVAEYDVEQAPIRPGKAKARDTMCGACAYRPNSPERTGAPDAAGDEELLDDLVYRGVPFWCHVDMRRPVRYRHPSGVVIEASDLEFAPAMDGAQPYKADGTPADMCGGWALRLAKLEARRATRESAEEGRDATR